VIRRQTFRGETCLVIVQPDGSAAYLPSWMTEPAAAHCSLVDTPCFPAHALLALSELLAAALSSPAVTPRDGGDSGATTSKAARSVRTLSCMGGDTRADRAGVGELLAQMLEAMICDAGSPTEGADEQDHC